MRYLLDTSTCLHLIKERSSGMMAKFMQHPPQDIAISVLAFFELRNGAERSEYPQQASKALDKFLNSFNLIFLDGSAAEDAVKITTQLEKKGISISPLALLTAGIARSRRMTQFSR